MKYSDYIAHHGIMGQKWGKRNGPPYPLKGSDYTSLERKYNKKKGKHYIGSIKYNKKHFDSSISKGTKFQTLSYDKNRTKAAEFIFATHDKYDKAAYQNRFNKRVSIDLYDETGEKLGKGYAFKYDISNVASQDLKVASEDSSAKVFTKLYKENRDFSNFVNDPNRLEKYFGTEKLKFKGYREGLEALKKVQRGKDVTSDDLNKVYRMFNYIIPNDGAGNSRIAKDVAIQRAKFFKELKKNGYSAVLDTNDALYGGYKVKEPVIVFDMDKLIPNDAKRLTLKDKNVARLSDYTHTFLKYTIGLEL